MSDNRDPWAAVIDDLRAENVRLKARAERAEKRIREAAWLFEVPDAGRYWNDWIETKRVRWIPPEKA